MKANKSLQYILYLSILIYSMGGWLFEDGNLLSITSVLVWFIISLYYAFKTISSSDVTKLDKIIFAFWILHAIYFTLSPKSVIGTSEGGGTMVYTSLNMLKLTSVCVLSYFPFSFFTKRNTLNKKLLFIFCCLLLLVYANQFILSRNNLINMFGTDSVVNNMAYVFVRFFPLFWLISEKKATSLVGFMVAIYFVIIGNKRGALLCFAFQTIVFVTYMIKQQKQSNFKIGSVLFVLLLLGVLGYFVVETFESNYFFQQRLLSMINGEDDGSGRNEYYSNIFKKFSNGSLFDQLFGLGYGGSIMINGNYAHNDWMELLADQGILGCSIYALLYLTIFRFYKMRRNLLTDKERRVFISAFFSILMVSLFSMSYCSNSSSYLFMVFGILLNKQNTDVHTLQDSIRTH